MRYGSEAAVVPVRAFLQSLITLAAVIAVLVFAAGPAGAATHSVTYDHYSLKIDGKRVYVWSGEFHYWRLPSPDLWRDVLQKLKAAGYNATSIYFDWGFHSPAPGVYDFSGVRATSTGCWTSPPRWGSTSSRGPGRTSTPRPTPAASRPGW